MRVIEISVDTTLVEKYTQDDTSSLTQDIHEVHVGITADRPTYADVPVGSIFYDTTLGKINVAGAADWEVVTSA